MDFNTNLINEARILAAKGDDEISYIAKGHYYREASQKYADAGDESSADLFADEASECFAKSK